MPEITLVANNGKLAGLTPQDDARYQKFRRKLETLGDSCIRFEWREPRSGPFHRRHFAMLGALFACQEQFHDARQFRKWGEAGAGYADLVPGPKGKPIGLVRSIAYHRLDQDEFSKVHEAVFEFYRSEHARRFLWPHLGDQESWEMVEAALGEFA